MPKCDSGIDVAHDYTQPTRHTYTVAHDYKHYLHIMSHTILYIPAESLGENVIIPASPTFLTRAQCLPS